MKRYLFLVLSIFSYLSGVGIATGETTGTYYTIGKEIAEVCGREIGGLEAIATDGSLDNIKRLMRNPTIKFAIVQHDVLMEIKNSSRYNKRLKKVADSLRVVMPLYNEDIHIIIKKGLNVKNLNQLKDKRVSIGNDGSGMNITSMNIARVKGFNWRYPYKKDIRESLKDIIDGKLDAVIYAVGIPGKVFDIREGDELFNIYKDNFDILDIGKERDLEMIYRPSTINKIDYEWLDDDRETKALKAILVTYAYKRGQPSYNRVKKLYSCIKDNLPKLQHSNYYHPRWREVNPKGFSEVNWKVHSAVKEVLQEEERKNQQSTSKVLDKFFNRF